MNNRTLQQDIGNFAAEKFWGDKSNKEVATQIMTKMEAEFIELKEAVDKARGEHSNEVVQEAADVLFMLFQICEILGPFAKDDLLVATMEKLDINKGRNWELQPDGTYQHVPKKPECVGEIA